jgi:class 3 adenylate cyclase
VTAGTGSAGTNGFLFCDLRGYTAFVEAHGDQAAADLLATYRALVRTAIGAHAGAEIKTEGDSVYVVFPAASAAVEAGLEIVAAAAEASTREAPIRVGVGVHAGETVATTEGLVGGAVNIAARVCAKAKASEVLVTDTVRALTRTYLPYRYTSLGTQQLKGIAGGIPLYRVEAVPSSGRARLARQLGARRGRLLVLAGLVVVAVVAATGVYAINRPTDCLSLPASTKDVVARIDPARNCVVAVYPTGQRPGAVVVADDVVWVANVEDQTLTWIDTRTLRTYATAAGGIPIDLARGPGSVIVLDRNARVGSGIAESDLASDQVATISNSQKRMIGTPGLLPPNPVSVSGYLGIAVVADRAWVTNSTTGEVVRVSNSGGFTKIKVIPTSDRDPRNGIRGTGLGPIASGAGAVWVANTDQPVLYRLEGFSGTPLSVSLDGDQGSVAMGVSESAIWLARADGLLTRVSPAGGSVATFDLGGKATSLAASASVVWNGDLLGAVVRRVDAATGQVVATITVGGRPAGVAIGPDGSAWVTIQAP